MIMGHDLTKKKLTTQLNRACIESAYFYFLKRERKKESAYTSCNRKLFYIITGLSNVCLGWRFYDYK